VGAAVKKKSLFRFVMINIFVINIATWATAIPPFVQILSPVP